MATKFKLKTDNNPSSSSNECSLDAKTKSKCQNFLTKAKLAMYMKSGLDIKDAAKLCGISEYQLGILRSDPDFEALIEFCSVDCEKMHIKNINDAGKMGAWQASAWMLERKFPEKYAKKDTVKHEYEIKFLTFQKVLLNVINTLDPSIKQIIMQKLRGVNLESEIYEMQVGGENSVIAQAIVAEGN